MDVSDCVVTWLLIQIFAGFSERIFVLMRWFNRKSIEMRLIMATHFDAMKKNGRRFSWQSWGTAKCKSHHTSMMDWRNHMLCQCASRSIRFSSQIEISHWLFVKVALELDALTKQEWIRKPNSGLRIRQLHIKKFRDDSSGHKITITKNEWKAQCPVKFSRS